MQALTIALAKGRILREALPLLAAAGIEPAEDLARSRRLIVETTRPGVRLVVVRAADVPAYVEHGGAHLGVTGADVLMEHGAETLYEPVDLGIARCRLMVAAPAGRLLPPGRLRVATKYPRIARRHFAAEGRHVDLIKLYGSMELAPLVGMADCIVDLVETGRTLAANGLEPRALVAEISARLVVNRAAHKLHHPRVEALVARIAQAAAGRARGETA
ncbi:ATP phosphoribosyltransferase [Inmirania thermothiophila]|uniref:ATP phosphoribosyltransferase n=1 Tax=Inmirania thermothiophila TaxID=1750597 RepID=A0A3N1XT08_9GAMM|nr:ATP phosphoribosyltransferase [Inmirania thermothiophila]ROR29775.1 ATP phosphoribosyltransferase (homohexameric) [Inmirania thermothiophila]